MSDLFGEFLTQSYANKDGRVKYNSGVARLVMLMVISLKTVLFLFRLVPLVVQKVHTKPFT